ncbi:DNA (cytosine-5)-methyltransferase 3 [Colletotrichum aenigma]|uniref:DNA (cytosine-5)-methyltransferase 3 n=1 Tax=Colletotrichum aenigma TaxID=1215731 RepID=UPI001872DFA3|nr:DNA (cytosine-5)-methyltransferase 3 [Colletotrichum aenigma]KAF5521550.1 DNA (cytosine-5)-methyltransferase 3 [Colletotrichum aenigma]
MANTLSEVHPFIGSIDDLQRLALEGKFSDKVPNIGAVDFVSAGSPCPGFSRLTNDKNKPKLRKDQSLVAAFASFVDTYRPKYGLLENVLEIVQPCGKKDEDVFCQLICALVGLGYQTHFFLLDAWPYGSPQSRSRVFLCFAAPGHRLPELPLHSHSHYQPVPRWKTLGKLPNNEPMGEQLVMPTPFNFIGSEEATADLPNIVDGKVDICIPFPDHRLAHGYTKYLRNQLSVIPTHPYGMSFMTTWDNGHGIMTKAERDFFPAKGDRVTQASSPAWGRCFPQKVMQTVTAAPSPADARLGRILHWNQNRILTVMEARRAQGFLDHEVILGQPKDQWRVVGNSVAREVSLALGLSFREAWLGSLVDGDEADSTLDQQPILNDMDIAQLSTPPGLSSRSTRGAGADTLGSSRPLKRPLESTLEAQLFVSKMAKTSADGE